MRQFPICIKSFADIQAFVKLATAQPFDVRICNNGYTINAKSLMSMFGLNFRQPLLVQVTCGESEFLLFREKATPFLSVI